MAEGQESIDGPEDLDLETIESEEEDYSSSPPEYQIGIYPADFTLEVLHTKWLSGEIVIPAFQRQFVWKQAQASKLIESFLAGLPVPPVFLYTDRESQKQLVVDGQQRLKTVFFFLEEGFGDLPPGEPRTPFRLTGLSGSSKWQNKTFSQLTEPDQRRLKNTILRAVIIQQLDPKDDTSIYHIFERLNTGGTLLKNQEVRNCVYGGPFNDLLLRLNRYPSWRRILGKDKIDSRQKDVELILRFFALKDNIANYRQPMKDFLSRYMKKNRFAKDAFLQTHEESFSRTCDRLVSELGTRPFHVWSGLNAAVFDSVATSFANNPNAKISNLRERYDGLTNEPGYVESVRARTTNDVVVQRRMDLAERLLFGKASVGK